MSKSATDGSYFMDDVFFIIKEGMINSNIEPERAEGVALMVAEKVKNQWSGCTVYIPTGKLKRAAATRVKINADFNGKNHKELSRKYNLSLQRIYRILKQK